MKFTVFELPKAQADKSAIAHWLHERSPAGAEAWLTAYDSLVAKLENHAASYGQAPENNVIQADIRQAIFKTRRGRIYRLLFIVEEEEVFILRVRGPGQAPVDPNSLT